jgi:hypothetical protein
LSSYALVAAMAWRPVELVLVGAAAVIELAAIGKRGRCPWSSWPSSATVAGVALVACAMVELVLVGPPWAWRSPSWCPSGRRRLRPGFI